jgi:hypothetical protein
VFGCCRHAEVSVAEVPIYSHQIIMIFHISCSVSIITAHLLSGIHSKICSRMLFTFLLCMVTYLSFQRTESWQRKIMFGCNCLKMWSVVYFIELTLFVQILTENNNLNMNGITSSTPRNMNCFCQPNWVPVTLANERTSQQPGYNSSKLKMNVNVLCMGLALE